MCKTVCSHVGVGLLSALVGVRTTGELRSAVMPALVLEFVSLLSCFRTGDWT